MSKAKIIKRIDRSGQIGLDYEVEVRDKDGKLISKCKGRADPFTRAWVRMIRTAMNGQAYGGSYVTLKDTGNTDKTFYGCGFGTNTSFISTRAPANSDAYGIVVGTSDVAFSRDQYNLQGKIAQGSGSGQLIYGETTVEDYTDEDNVTRFRIIRAFTNTSGASITVKEIGIVIGHWRDAATFYYLLVARDILGTPQTIPDGAALTVRYRPFLSYA